MEREGRQSERILPEHKIQNKANYHYIRNSYEIDLPLGLLNGAERDFDDLVWWGSICCQP